MSRRLPAALFTALLVLSACGDDDDPDVASDAEPATEETTTDDTEASTTTAAGDEETTDGTGAPVTTAESELGEILVDAEGFTLYGFTKDTAGEPTCSDGCAETWPPAFVDSEELPEGLDPAVFSVVEHPSGQYQLKAGDWPLYRYTPDTEPGATGGQGVGGVWFVVDPQGGLIM